MNEKSTKELCKYLYATLVVTAFMQMTFSTMLLGICAMLAALIIAYVKRPSVKDTIFENHMTWMIRTFWIGGSVYLPILTVIATFIIYYAIDFTPILNAIATGEITGQEDMMMQLMEKESGTVNMILLGTSAPFLVWWLHRCWRGFDALRQNKPVDNLMGWL